MKFAILALTLSVAMGNGAFAANWYYTALYPYCDHAASMGWSASAQSVRFDNPELNALPVFREAVPVYHAQRKPPPAESGMAVWRTLAENFLPGEPDAEIIAKNPKPDRPLIVGFGGKRHVETYGGRIELDREEWRRWKAAHTNLLCCWTHIEWDNTVPLTYRRAPNIQDETRRREVTEFLGEKPRNRYERVKVQRRFYDRMKELYYGDDDVTGVMFASLFSGHVAAGFGAKTLIVETTNTTGKDAPEYRWNLAPMFCRGAARQFDLPWEWYVAVYMNGWTSKGEWWNNTECVYPWSAEAEFTQKGSYHPGPDHGVSRSLQRRAYYYAYLNGANLVEQEEWSAMLLTWDKAKGRTVLSPRGEDFVRYHEFTKRHPDRGEPYVPVAILVPYAQGYPTWGGFPWGVSQYGYTAGDQALDAIFFTIVPGFDRKTELLKGGEMNLHNSRYAMMYDVLTPDAPQEPAKLLAALRRYRAVVLAGDYPDRSFEKTLAEYERGGGRVIRVGEREVAPRGISAINAYQAGRLAEPAVERIFDSLQREYFPVRVEGDCLYGLNRTEKGWWLWLFNNRGVTKFADTPQKIDSAADVDVTIDLGRLAGHSLVELMTGAKLSVDGGKASLRIPAGDFRIVKLESRAEANFQFRKRLLEVHPKRISANVKIVALGDDPVVRHAAADFADFIIPSEEGEPVSVEIGVAAEKDSLTSRVTVENGRVRVTGATAKEAFQGVCRLEDELVAAGGFAALRPGSRTYTRMFSPRMTHSGYEVESFPDKYLDRTIVAREFGAGVAAEAMRAFEKWDAAFAWHQTGDRDFWGPLRVGPSYPLHLPGEKLPQLGGIEGGCKVGVNGGTGWKYMMPTFRCPTNEIAGNVELSNREIALLQEGADILSVAMAKVPPGKRERARRILGVGEFYLRSVTTLRNVYRFHEAALTKDSAAMRGIIAEERENVLKTIPLVDFDSALGWEPTMGYVCDRKALEWKLDQLVAFNGVF